LRATPTKIAAALIVSEDAVEKHVGGILRKLNIAPAASSHRRVLAVLAFLRDQQTPSR
jgi:DNA-binding NarL/FixJ family response regulator